MVMWAERHVAYKVGFCGLVVAILFYVIGFALPYWAMLRLHHLNYPDQTLGLWQACVYPSLTCVSNVHGQNPPWINAARAMSSVALILFCMTLVSGYYRNVSRYGQSNTQTPGRHVECSAIVATVAGGIGCVIFAAEFQRVYVRDHSLGQLHWAFTLVCCSLALAVLSSFLMFAFNRPHATSSPSRALQARASNGVSVSVQLCGEDIVHIPYFGDVTAAQLAEGAGPLQPPSYDVVSRDPAYSAPPTDTSLAPPLYEDIAKDGTALSTDTKEG